MEVCTAVECGLNEAYPSQRPWIVIQQEYTCGQYQPRDWLQITRRPERQPCHWDTSSPWFKNEKGHWAALSVILHINDGLSTFLPGQPVKVFEEMRETALEMCNQNPAKLSTKNHVRCVNSLLGILDACDTMDKGVPMSHRQRSRAGQCLAFHAGEQAHAGMGWDGLKDPCTPEWIGRVVSYFFALPKSEADRVWANPIFNPEFPWGLMREGITNRMVFTFFFLYFIFWFSAMV